MPDTHAMPVWPSGEFESPLWADQTHPAIVNLRGDPSDRGWRAAVTDALGMDLPGPCSTVSTQTHRLVWAGPDDWFVISDRMPGAALESHLRGALTGQMGALTDVSSGYFRVTLAGARARELLSHGCPLDVSSHAFPVHHAAGTHFFKVGLYLWLTDDQPTFQMLVRRSFIDHFWQLVAAESREFGVNRLIAG